MSESKASLTALVPPRGSTHRKRRVGRGTGSGLGKTCGRGHKGQRSRAGKKIKAGFEGGQMPLHRRIPKRGFNSRQAASWLRLPTAALARLEPGEISLELLREKGIASHQHSRVKFYLSGEVTGKYTLKDIHATAGARAQIEKAGGKFVAAKEEPAKPKAKGKTTAADSGS